MNELLKKLNFKNHARIVVLNAPDEFSGQLEAWRAIAPVSGELGTQETFALAFVHNEAELRDMAVRMKNAKAEQAVTWVAYPKGSSKKYSSDINRDSAFRIMLEYGLEVNRNVAIDEDWSALRFKARAS